VIGNSIISHMSVISRNINVTRWLRWWVGTICMYMYIYIYI